MKIEAVLTANTPMASTSTGEAKGRGLDKDPSKMNGISVPRSVKISKSFYLTNQFGAYLRKTLPSGDFPL
jgi:hypothetical protein